MKLTHNKISQSGDVLIAVILHCRPGLNTPPPHFHLVKSDNFADIYLSSYCIQSSLAQGEGFISQPQNKKALLRPLLPLLTFITAFPITINI